MGGRVRTVFLVGDQAIEEGVPAAFRGVPLLIGEDGNPDWWVNEYLLARRNGDWAPEQPQQGIYVEIAGRAVLRADLGYLRNRAYQLDVLRRWCSRNGVTYKTIGEQDLENFAEDLEEGRATQGGIGLRLQSVNQYLTSAVDFLNFAAKRGLRDLLSLRMFKVRGNQGAPVLRPAIIRRVNPAEITDWYTEGQVDTFIEALDTSALKLAARIFHRMGLRLSEVLLLKVSDFPEISDFRKDPSRRSIRIQGKFKRFRRVELDADVLPAIIRYRDFDRRLVERKSKTKTDILLIETASQGTVSPLKHRRVQKAFTAARRLTGYQGLSPHMLRHHYAAHYLLRAWKRRSDQGGIMAYAFERTAGEAILSTDLLRLKENLGHARLETTIGYLNGVSYLLGSKLPEIFAAELDGDDK
ncbi:hypothetical protein EAH89_10940 [Roseomonas nepalensis]|uniref:Tyr recombinase domain-containing protein n=1 Tax=Muricoccus nepalensis TaxID=1854500 RepID=A0A502G7S2_9PROT|nr:tyrosine-type recombinase/integrase [Roseomonas nepalensis]TPG57440.1 hypothetical protein EAH89_10940 [Roseomonas nepalensis]